METKFTIKLHWPNSEIHTRTLPSLKEAKKCAKAAVYDGFAEIAEVFDIDNNLVLEYPKDN